MKAILLYANKLHVITNLITSSKTRFFLYVTNGDIKSSCSFLDIFQRAIIKIILAGNKLEILTTNI